MSSFARIYALVRQIPPGRVSTYGQVALLCGNPRWARVVGYALHCAPPDVPWHRVVNRQGALCVPSGRETQRLLLEAEGVPFIEDGRVALKSCLWLGPDA